MYIFTPNTLIESAKINANFAETTTTRWDNLYKFMGGKTAVQNLSDAVWADVTFTEQYDTNNNFDGTTYTIPIDGYYHFDYAVLLQVSAQAGTYFAAEFCTSDSKEYGYQSHSTTSFPHWEAALSASCTVYMTADQTIKVRAYIDVGSGTPSIHGGANQTSIFSGYLVSKT